MLKREKNRDDREYDKTQLRENGHGQAMGRDYSAHFWRWSFARRFIDKDDSVLEIGCGQDKPLSKILTGGAAPHVGSYVGVDLNDLKESNSQRLLFMPNFNFVEQWQELKHEPGFDIVVHYEVIEHMKVEHGAELLKGCYEVLRPGGRMLMSTPCYDGVRHAANHIHEYYVDELKKATEDAGFKVLRRFGTFMDIKHIGKTDAAVQSVKERLAEYYDNDALSCIFAPLYPDQARNNLWVCQK